MALRIVSDTSCDLPPHLEGELSELGVTIIPFTFRFGLVECIDKSMGMGEFLSRAEETWPTTSVPAAGQFAEAFGQIVEAGDQVLCVTITSKHSGTYGTAVAASQQFAPGQVTVVDSRSLSLGQGFLVLAAARAAAAGASSDEVVQIIGELHSRQHLFITLDTVEYLVRGGRASRLSGLMAGLLRIRPVLTLQDGELTLLDRVRGRKASVRRLLELAQERLPAEALGTAHIACEEEGRRLRAQLAAETGYPEEEIIFTETGMVIATHGGPGTLGIMVVREPGGRG